jgi:hypothetical protein
MSLKQHWPRWLFASFSKHFKDKLAGSTLYIEGQKRATSTIADFFELRIDGPYITEENKNYYRLYTEISLLVSSALNETDYHSLQRLLGKGVDAFTAGVQIYKYGDGPDDDQSLLGCASLLSNKEKRERLQVNNFGIIDRAVNLQQGTIEGHYEMYIDYNPNT